jgi:hypothetical protein
MPILQGSHPSHTFPNELQIDWKQILNLRLSQRWSLGLQYCGFSHSAVLFAHTYVSESNAASIFTAVCDLTQTSLLPHAMWASTKWRLLSLCCFPLVSAIRSLHVKGPFSNKLFWMARFSGLENREYGRRDPSRWPRVTLYTQELALTSPTNGGRSVGIARSLAQATEFSLDLPGSVSYSVSGDTYIKPSTSI